MRHATFVATIALVCGVLTGPAAAQAPAQRDAALREALRPVLADAQRDSVPIELLEAKAREGVAKRRPAPVIVAAVRQLAEELREARVALRAAAPAAVLAAGELRAAAEAARLGTPWADLRALRAAADPATNLEIPFAVLGALVERGVPAGDARAVIQEMLKAGVTQARMVEVPARIDVALRVGAGPIAALNSALQGLGIPVPPLPVVRPNGATERRGPGDL
jgi:hypothetical protein